MCRKNNNITTAHNNSMKKYMCLITMLCTFVFGVLLPSPISYAKAEERPQESSRPKLAIVIDDFGEDRAGVEKMLSLDIMFTGAVMPSMEFSVEDAERLHKNGKEVMLHMPMEAYGNLPLSWYGPVMIKNTYSKAEARNVLTSAIQSVPHVKSVNIHMGTAVCQNRELAEEILCVTKERNLPFLDSKTIEGSVFPQIAVETQAKFLERDNFLEVSGQKNYQFTKQRLQEGITLAKTKGFAVVIGHVGPVGGETTAQVLQDMQQELKNSGVELVGFSQLFI